MAPVDPREAHALACRIDESNPLEREARAARAVDHHGAEADGRSEGEPPVGVGRRDRLGHARRATIWPREPLNSNRVPTQDDRGRLINPNLLTDPDPGERVAPFIDDAPDDRSPDRHDYPGRHPFAPVQIHQR